MEKKNLISIDEYNTARAVLKTILIAAKRECNLKDFRDVTFVLSNESFIHFVLSDNSVKNRVFRFDKNTLTELCEKIAEINLDLAKQFTAKNIEITAHALQSFRQMAAKVHQKDATKVWITYHEVFGYYVFDGTTCIMKFTHEMFYEFCKQNSMVQ